MERGTPTSVRGEARDHREKAATVLARTTAGEARRYRALAT